mmetsp:Transcript_4969/g.11169  ORF Transcript_4969/g.11169 Transcript_4969/m.11169 type:complete len:254 (+) Transcript_4969:1390-2151(+)
MDISGPDPTRASLNCRPEDRRTILGAVVWRCGTTAEESLAPGATAPAAGEKDVPSNRAVADERRMLDTNRLRGCRHDASGGGSSPCHRPGSLSEGGGGGEGTAFSPRPAGNENPWQERLSPSNKTSATAKSDRTGTGCGAARREVDVFRIASCLVGVVVGVAEDTRRVVAGDARSTRERSRRIFVLLPSVAIAAGVLVLLLLLMVSFVAAAVTVAVFAAAKRLPSWKILWLSLLSLSLLYSALRLRVRRCPTV